MKLALGTVQFGLAYGVANQHGQVSPGEAAEILAVARKAGIDTVDTAIAYGESETCLGQAGVSGLRVVTKLPPVPAQCVDVGAWVKAQVQTSLQRLGIEHLYGLLLHQPGQLGEAHGPALAKALQALKSDGYVQKVGVSIYAPTDLDLATATCAIDLVQAPFNLIDRRLHDSGWLHKLSDQGVEVHVRSAFLQGLLLMPAAAVPHKFSPWKEILGTWHQWLSAHSRISPAHACLAFVSQYPEVERVVIGVDDMTQLKQLLAVAESPLLEEIPDLSCTDEFLINPSNWNSL